MWRLGYPKQASGKRPVTNLDRLHHLTPGASPAAFGTGWAVPGLTVCRQHENSGTRDALTQPGEVVVRGRIHLQREQCGFGLRE